MLDIKLIRSNPELVKENIKKKFQDEKLPLVDEVLELDAQFRASKGRGDELRQQRNTISKEIGKLMSQGKKDEAQEVKKQVQAIAGELEEMERKEAEMTAEIRKRMLVIPNLIDDSRAHWQGRQRKRGSAALWRACGAPTSRCPTTPRLWSASGGIDLDSARKTSGNGFYYLMGDIARLQSAVISYARDFMIDKGFTYCIPPFMIQRQHCGGRHVPDRHGRHDVQDRGRGPVPYRHQRALHDWQVHRHHFARGDLAPDLDQLLPLLPQGEGRPTALRERGVYRIHQFEKQEMIVICKPEDSMAWYDKMWSYSVELFRSLDIPVRQLECCSGDLADLKVKSCDIEAWSPRQKKYFEVCSCSNMGDAQAPPAENPRQGRGRPELPAPHLEQHRGGPAPDAHRLPGEQPPGRRQRAHPRGIAALHGRQGRHPLTRESREGQALAPVLFCWKKTKKEVPPAAGELLGKRLWKVFRVCAKTCGKHVGRLKKPRKYAGKSFSTDFLAHVENLFCGP